MEKTNQRKNKDVAATKAVEPSAAQEAAKTPHDVVRSPLSIIRVQDCSASIWAREHLIQGAPKVFYSISLERSYKDRDGRYRYTRSFDPDSLGAVVQLCQRASEAIASLTQTESVTK